MSDVLLFCFIRSSVLAVCHWVLMCRSRIFFFFKQRTAYEMRISDWSSDVCSSDLVRAVDKPHRFLQVVGRSAAATLRARSSGTRGSGLGGYRWDRAEVVVDE